MRPSQGGFSSRSPERRRETLRTFPGRGASCGVPVGLNSHQPGPGRLLPVQCNTAVGPGALILLPASSTWPRRSLQGSPAPPGGPSFHSRDEPGTKGARRTPRDVHRASRAARPAPRRASLHAERSAVPRGSPDVAPLRASVSLVSSGAAPGTEAVTRSRHRSTARRRTCGDADWRRWGAHCAILARRPC